MVVGKTKLYCLTRPDKSVETQSVIRRKTYHFLMTDLGLSLWILSYPNSMEVI